MQPPEGYHVLKGHVCKLKTSLCSLKQASSPSASGSTILYVYVDDILIAEKLETCIQEVKTYLNNIFTIKDLGVAKDYLGLEIARSAQRIAVSQTKCIRDLLTDDGMTQAKPATTPLPSGIKFFVGTGQMLSNHESYRRLEHL
ncbi:hypothetical protein Sango_2296000 [Sesamum angolense]|uniref:Reverse transcriptase Ty1/copia-type domain-containing protein n=1 Tax=Sesamum angolense TaxID=2727404 RepID=A0AAE1WA45_9LAMI|nr:hypothetical protein Sango_2296000 [Sesamum angolense]